VDFNFLAAIIAGLVGTAAMTMLMMMAPKMGMPKMDIPGMLGSMFGAPGNRMMGLVMHFMMGVIFAIVYGLLFSAVTANIILLGVIFGIGHWFVVGIAMGMMPMMHAGIKSGDVPEPGMFMTKMGGMMGAVGSLMGHVLFGLVVGIVYGLVAGGFGG